MKAASSIVCTVGLSAVCAFLPLVVMVIAACEVVIGLGIIVAMYRNRLPIDIDELSELRG